MDCRRRFDRFEDGSDRARRFMELVKRYENFDQLTTPMLNEFIEKIVVHGHTRKGCRDTTQQVDIYLNFIGAFTVPQPAIDPAVLAQQEEERRKKLERQERLHQNYLKRKASRKQQEYDRKYNEKRKAERQATKATALAAASEAQSRVTILAA